MAFIEEYVNYSDYEIPYIKRPDLEYYLGYSYNLSEGNITLKGKTIKIKSFSFQYRTGEHVSNIYLKPYTESTKPFYIIKSKNEDTLYKYLGVRVYNSNNNICAWMVGDDLALSDVILTQTYYQDRNPHIGIIEVGDYICRVVSTENGSSIYWNCIGMHKDSIKQLIGEIDARKYDPEYGEPSTPNGYVPNADPTSDTITIPTTPSIGVSNVGFVNVYRPTQGALQNLGADLFPDFEELPDVQPDDDTLTMLAQGFEYLGKNISIMLKSYINSNLINYIIDCHCLPVTPTTGETENIKIGFKSFDQTAPRVSSDYVDFDCGSLSIGEYYGNFIDYVGTRASLYLPFVGFVPIKNEYFQNGTLSVRYRFNIIDGSFMCYVLSSSSKSQLRNSVIGTYSGNACVHIPITGVNYANMVSGVVTGGASLIGGVATGNVGLAVSGALNTIASKPQMQSSNSYNSTSSFLGIRYPYLLIEREVSNFSELYPSENGLPLNVTKKIGELTGYIEMDDKIHININCMDEEKQMILDRLTSGIII